jgi:hypothetical protein
MRTTIFATLAALAFAVLAQEATFYSDANCQGTEASEFVPCGRCSQSPTFSPASVQVNDFNGSASLAFWSNSDCTGEEGLVQTADSCQGFADRPTFGSYVFKCA